MSFRAQRSRRRAPPFLPLLVGATLVVARPSSAILSFLHPQAFFPRRACPREDTPPVVLASRSCPREDEDQRSPNHSERSAAEPRNLVAIRPPPSPRRGDPSGRPSLFGHSLLPSPSSSPLRSSREEPALVKTPLPLSSRRDPAPVKTGGGDPSPSPTCHSERSEAEPRNLVALGAPFLPLLVGATLVVARPSSAILSFLHPQTLPSVLPARPALVKTPLLSSRMRGPITPSPTCHSERSRGILSPSRPVCPP